MYKVVVHANRAGNIAEYPFKGNTLDEAVNEAQKFADRIQAAEPLCQLNFFAFRKKWEPIYFDKKHITQLEDISHGSE